jgi:molecular chaperone GrpE
MHTKQPKLAKVKKNSQKATKATKAVKAIPKRSLATAKKSIKPAFSPLSFPSFTPTRRSFATKEGERGQEGGPDQEQGGDNSHQQQQQQGGDEDPVSQLQKRVSTQNQEIAELKRMINDNKLIVDEWQNKCRQLQDRVKQEIEEQHSIHDRYKREIGDVKKFAVGKFAKGLLEGVDALEAAAKATNGSLQRNQDEAFVKLAEGLNMTTALFHKALASEGITKYESLGQTVDPNLHFITAQLPHPTAPAGTITHMLKEGYHIHERVLRPAQVCVSAPPQNAV